MHSSEPDHRTEDRQWNAVDRTMQRHDYRPEALIETLHTAQERYGFLDFGTLGRIADRLGLAPGETVLILGAGPVGLMMALAVRAGGGVPFIVDPDAAKLDRSRMFRLKTGVEAAPSSDRDAFDLAVNATPALSALVDGVSRIRSGGRFCLFSGLPAAEAIPAAWVNDLHYREIQVCGAYGCTRDQMQRAVSLLDAHREPAEWLIEDRISLGQVQDALTTILTGRALKYVVEFGGC